MKSNLLGAWKLKFGKNQELAFLHAKNWVLPHCAERRTSLHLMAWMEQFTQLENHSTENSWHWGGLITRENHHISRPFDVRNWNTMKKIKNSNFAILRSEQKKPGNDFLIGKNHGV